MSLEINRLINERRIGLDDGCDYGASILDTMNAAARARTKSCYQLPPAAGRQQTDVGNRACGENWQPQCLWRKVITGVYQLHLSGHTPVQIARLLKCRYLGLNTFLNVAPASAGRYFGWFQHSRCQQRLKLCAARRQSRRHEVSMSELILTEEFLLRRPPISLMDYWDSTSISALILNRWRA